MKKIKQEDIKEIYTLDINNGVLILEKVDKKMLKPKAKYDYTPTVIINPTIGIIGGVLNVTALELKHECIAIPKDWHWLPKPIEDLEKGWEDDIFYSHDNIVKQNVVKWVGTWPFKKRKKIPNVKHLRPGFYLKTFGDIENYTTSNYRLVGYNENDTRGII